MLQTTKKYIHELNQKETLFMLMYSFGTGELFDALEYAKRGNLMIAEKKFDLQNFIYTTDFYLQNLSPNVSSDCWKVSNNRLGGVTVYIRTNYYGKSEALAKACLIAKKHDAWCTIPICSVLENME